MHFDHLIQRMMLTEKNDTTLFERAVNKAHINYYLPLPLDEEAFSLYVRKALKRHHDLTRPFQQLQMLSQITRDLFSDKERYKREALNDSLTGLLNRRAFNSLLESFFEKKSDPVTSIPFTLAMIDLDHFKKVNDQYGHVGGDEVLKSFSRQLTLNLRGGLDQAFRYGGEEFAILSFHSTKYDMVQLLKRLKELVQSSPVDFEGRSIAFTFSAGVAHSDEAHSPGDLIERADQQLYKAKAEGRNRICAGSE
jgi:diguanylate cyclase (GGDEF)-like protein